MLDAEPGVEVLDGTTIGVDEVAGLLDAESVRSVGVEEDVASDEDDVEGEDDAWTKGTELVDTDTGVDVDDGDELATWAADKFTSKRVDAAAISTPPATPFRNETFIMDLFLLV